MQERNRLHRLRNKAVDIVEADLVSQEHGHRFPCLALAYACAEKGGTACPAMNGANEEAVAMFLRDEIGFYDIYGLVSQAVEAVPFLKNPTLEEILEADRQARAAVKSLSHH